ncbi:hypothetical protein [Acidovorax sp. NB1]|uniref:hypothetical protein n=1 Tax=Acidovorax sp. NB1 TaxID=1943571 RepID=UPI001484CDC5|nr:hypothetical protein [Acidovorax sp. NB1]
MERRQRDIFDMAERARLSPVRYERRDTRGVLLCQAENSVQREFSVSLGTRGDIRGDQNELSRMKRFARENAVLTEPANPGTTTPKKDYLAMLKAPAPTAPALDPVAFYRACEWLKGQKIVTFASLEALAQDASEHVGATVSEADMKLVMTTLNVQEPALWHEPKDPQAILVRELSTIMKRLGETPSPAFDRLAASLLRA